MDFTDKIGKKYHSILACVLVLTMIGFIACGGGDSQTADEAADSSSQKTEKATTDKTASPSTESKTPAGWKTGRFENWSVAFPGNWNEDPDTNIWQPGEVGPFMGRPDVSVFMGGIPVMPPADFEERVKTRNNGELQERVNVSVSGYSGFKCSWEQMGKKYRGLFLEEKVGGGMIVIHFFDCQAPAAEFDQYKADFEKILDSVKKK